MHIVFERNLQIHNIMKIFVEASEANPFTKQISKTQLASQVQAAQFTPTYLIYNVKHQITKWPKKV